jgi:predicted SAM-dependent methyltransferase
MKDIYLHVGCGLIAPETWTNLDASWNARLARMPKLRSALSAMRIIPKHTSEIPWPSNITFHDVRRKLPYRDASVAAVYSSHMIEHLSRADVAYFLRECHRVLKDGGLIRLVTPDLECYAKTYWEAKQGDAGLSREAAERFLNSSGLIQDFNGANAIIRGYRRWKSYDLHKWLYDNESLSALLERIGFSDVRRKRFLESAIPAVQDVEREDRVRGSLCLEAAKNQSGPKG